MISVGVDVSKEKSTVCILKPYGEVISMLFEIMHTEKDLFELVTMLVRFSDDVKVVMEATGVYHLPVLHYLQNNSIFVSVINPYEMKQYLSKGLRKIKTDKQDSIAIAKYGLDYWHGLKEHKSNSETYDDLKLLGRQYSHYIKMRVNSILTLTHMLDYTMPGIKSLLKVGNDSSRKDKLSDFVEKYWHFDNITKMSEKRFINS